MALGTPVRSEIKSARPRSSQGRQRWDGLFLYVCLVTACMSVLILAFLLGSIIYQGAPQLTWRLLTNSTSSDPEKAGYYPALWGTIWICAICGMLSLPIGVCTAILLEEFVPKNRFLRFFHGLIELNITNLAGVPSVVYGILGLTAFVSTFGLFKDDPWEIGVRYFDQFLTEDNRVVLVPVTGFRALDTIPSANIQFFDKSMKPVPVRVIPAKGKEPQDLKPSEIVLRENEEPGRLAITRWYYVRFPLGKGVLTGGLTLMLVVLPIVIIASQEALRAVPGALREGAQGLGATSWQVVWNVTLPAALPGMMTGAILAGTDVPMPPAPPPPARLQPSMGRAPPEICW